MSIGDFFLGGQPAWNNAGCGHHVAIIKEWGVGREKMVKEKVAYIFKILLVNERRLVKW